MSIYGLQHSTQEGEDALSQGLEAFNQSISETISSEPLSYPPNMNNYMEQLARAMNKLSTLETFAREVHNTLPYTFTNIIVMKIFIDIDEFVKLVVMCMLYT